MKRMKAEAALLAALVSLVLWPAADAVADHTSETAIQNACLASGQAEAVCACIVREANSRFSHGQLELVGAAMPRLERITDDPQVGGLLSSEPPLTSEQLQALRQRAEVADVVIRQACGVGLRLGEGT
ncbi:hypothetical protein [Maricaulis sp. W15]|uniref:hypothetical protein n=1 Tax=Maricaulis sp. W15 TaxID=1772333 RepID=UPI000AC9CDBE|nr:hypothetical protein [Maricaulis sp. W15]